MDAGAVGDGVVLIGEPAGYNEPIIGEGLSMAMRDARTVRSLVPVVAADPDDFRSYERERFERIRRLTADVFAVVNVADGGDRAAWQA